MSGMKFLLLIAHGSRNKKANQEVAEWARQFDQRRGNGYAHVRHCFLDVLQPDIPAGIEKCVEEGAAAVDIFPLFLNTGNHVAADIPEIVIRKQSSCPKVPLKILPHLGSHPEFFTLLEKLIGK